MPSTVPCIDSDSQGDGHATEYMYTLDTGHWGVPQGPIPDLLVNLVPYRGPSSLVSPPESFLLLLSLLFWCRPDNMVIDIIAMMTIIDYLVHGFNPSNPLFLPPLLQAPTFRSVEEDSL